MISRPVTYAKLVAWVTINRPELAIHQEGKRRGYYRRDLGPVSSFHACGSRWQAVAEDLGALDPDEPRQARRPRSGRQPHAPGAAIAAALKDVERTIGAQEERGALPYAVAVKLWQRIDTLAGRMEAILCASPDYQEA